MGGTGILPAFDIYNGLEARSTHGVGNGRPACSAFQRRNAQSSAGERTAETPARLAVRDSEGGLDPDSDAGHFSRTSRGRCAKAKDGFCEAPAESKRRVPAKRRPWRKSAAAQDRCLQSSAGADQGFSFAGVALARRASGRRRDMRRPLPETRSPGLRS